MHQRSSMIFVGNRKKKRRFINTPAKAVEFLKVYFNAFRHKFDVIWSGFFFFIKLSQEMTIELPPLESRKLSHKENNLSTSFPGI